MCLSLTATGLRSLGWSFVLKRVRVRALQRWSTHPRVSSPPPPLPRHADLCAPCFTHAFAQFYYWRFTPTTATAFSQLYGITVSRIGMTPPQTQILAITTAGGASFTMFTKNQGWIGDIYSALIAPHYRGDVWCETWLNGACSAYSTVLDGVVVEMPTALRDALPAVSHHAGLPGTDLPSFCRGKYGYNTLNMASYSLNGYTMQNHRVRPSDLK